MHDTLDCLLKHVHVRVTLHPLTTTSHITTHIAQCRYYAYDYITLHLYVKFFTYHQKTRQTQSP